MSSLAPYSVGTCLCSLQPQKSSYSSSSPPVVFSSTSTSTSTIQYHHLKTYAVHPHPPLAVAILAQSESESKSNPTSHFKRRDALGIALSCGLLHPFFQPPQPSSAAIDTTAPCEFTVAPSGLAFCDKLVGTGPQALKGQLIKAHYVGRLESGKIFDSSYNRGKPLTFRVGVGEVIKGWDEGILGSDGVPPMLAGGKRTLKLPPELGYGSRGAGCRGGSCIIPPDSVLVFDVEFISKA